MLHVIMLIVIMLRVLAPTQITNFSRKGFSNNAQYMFTFPMVHMLKLKKKP